MLRCEETEKPVLEVKVAATPPACDVDGLTLATGAIKSNANELTPHLLLHDLNFSTLNLWDIGSHMALMSQRKAGPLD